MVDPGTLQSLLSAVEGKHWLLLATLVTLYVRKLLSDASSFPVRVPPQWLPAVTSGGGALYGLLNAHLNGEPWGPALLDSGVAAGAAGFFDAFAMGIFNHIQAPKWVQAILFIVDDLTGAPKGGGASQAHDVTKLSDPDLKRGVEAPQDKPPNVPPNAA